MIETPQRGKLGILVGGGPAPGINGVIHSVTIEAINNGLDVVGIYDGFEHLMAGRIVSKPLTIGDVSRIHLDGGSILRTSRANPTGSDALLGNCVRALIDAGISSLVAIGGDDTAYSAYRVARHAEEQAGVKIRTVHVPKTIDNDLPLPAEIRTFGYETARELGTRIVMNLMEEALTGRRWILVVTMGRKAGHLALGIGKSSGATLTLIPEEWGDRQIRLQEVVDILATSVIMRRATGKNYGVAIVAEGVLEQMAPEDLAGLEDAERDTYGHIQLSEINLSDILKKALRKELLKLGIDLRLINKDLGFELRCADPIAFDIDYTRTLGYGAVRFLLSQGPDGHTLSGGIVCLDDGRLRILPFDGIQDPETGRIRTRMVDVTSEHYKVAREYMIRLRRSDLQDESLLSGLAGAAKMDVAEFVKRFGPAVESDSAEDA